MTRTPTLITYLNIYQSEGGGNRPVSLGALAMEAARVAVSVSVVVPGGWVAACPGSPKTKYEYEAPRLNMNTKKSLCT